MCSWLTFRSFVFKISIILSNPWNFKLVLGSYCKIPLIHINPPKYNASPPRPPSATKFARILIIHHPQYKPTEVLTAPSLSTPNNYTCTMSRLYYKSKLWFWMLAFLLLLKMPSTAVSSPKNKINSIQHQQTWHYSLIILFIIINE